MTEETTIKVQSPSNHIDYKDVLRLRAHLNPHARMHGQRRTHMSMKDQRAFARSVKRARFMALIPFVSY
ncbi:MAG: 30S ribosomal protein S18 [Parcubacteria group bacterium CG2_30_44_11]|nr:MAG: 30S ribosomal protein S18 [Parcubacteria group bacterium CG2_30_44_11]